MHIPDGFLDPKVSAGLMGAAAMALGYCFAKVRDAVTALVPAPALAVADKGMGNVLGGVKRVLTGEGKRSIYKMGMVAAIIFAAQMFNFPVSQGTSGHLLGGVLAGVLLGPFAGSIAVAAVLGVQMLFFADGGIWALGANILNMAVVGVWLSYGIYFLLKKIAPEWIAILVAAWLSVVLASLACAYELGFSGTIPFSVIIPVMVMVHMVIGLAEGLITLIAVNLFRQMLKEEAPL